MPAERPFPFPPCDPLELPPGCADARPVCPVVLPTGDHAWLVSGYDAVRAVLTNRAFSRNLDRPDVARLGSGVSTRMGPLAAMMDDPAHADWRRVVGREFAPRQMERSRGLVREIAHHHLDALIAGPAPVDFVAAFARPYAIDVMERVTGVPKPPRNEPRAVFEFMMDLLERKRNEPGDDVLSRLVGELDTMGLLFTVAGILVAGWETTAAHLAQGLYTLLRTPGGLECLRDRPELVPRAVEELLRHVRVSDTEVVRYATQDVVVGDAVIPSGATVFLALPTANRCPERFPDPHRLDFGRGGGHLAFGAGPHLCLGAALARVELQVAYEVLLARLPRVELAARDVPVADGPIGGPAQLLIRW